MLVGVGLTLETKSTNKRKLLQFQTFLHEYIYVVSVFFFFFCQTIYLTLYIFTYLLSAILYIYLCIYRFIYVSLYLSIIHLFMNIPG